MTQDTKIEADGGPAFPLNDERMPSWEGMSLRDWFAGQALAGLLASNAMYGGKTDNRGAIAADAYRHADAMLAERSKAEGRAS